MTKKSRTKRFSAQYLTICHCNLNSIAGHNFIKVALLKAYFSVHEMEIKCLFDIYLDSSVPVDDDSLKGQDFGKIEEPLCQGHLLETKS